MKAIEKERSRRYDTSSGLARDIQRFLDEEPVEACPPSKAYLFKKFVKKNKGKVIAVGAVFSALSIGIMGTTWGFARARNAEMKALASGRVAIDERDQKEQQRIVAEQARLSEAEQRDKAERQLIEGILRPIGFGQEPNEAELRSFIDWSCMTDDQLKLRVIEVAMEDPEKALRLARRATRPIQACVGCARCHCSSNK